ncbi:MAG: hypothetical protein ACJAXA_002863 [Candidatus Aldehydirespiratoraceae bacterium]|jgi:hypothetical protein
MARIHFDVHHEFEQSSTVVWDELVDWAAHADWIPMTRVEVGDGAPTDVGHEFTAWTGLGPLSLEDRMRVARCDWDAAATSGECTVDKLGPILQGSAGFTVAPNGDGSGLDWFEDVTIRFVPQFLAPVFAKLGAIGFKQGMKGLAKSLSNR